MNPSGILHVVASVNPAVGGPAQSVPRLAGALSASGTAVRLLCLDYPEHGPLPRLPDGVLVAVQPNILTRPLRGWSPALESTLEQEAARSRIIHSHGLWMGPNHYAARAAARHHIPLVISPRGMLGSWALGRSAMKKKLLWFLRESRNLRSAAAFHATSAAESDDIRRAGFPQPVAVLPNGVALSDVPTRHRAWLDAAQPAFQGKRLALFLSRLHPKKGVDELLAEWALLDPSLRTGWQLIIAGPDLTGYRSVLEKRRAQDPHPEGITFTGGVEGEFKQALLHHADFLVLPTKEENFGIVVAEALAAGTPVITTRAAPWEALETHRCGWWIPGTPGNLRHALVSAMSCPPGELRAQGMRGREFVARELDWSMIAKRMALFYHWLCSGGAPPDFVRPLNQ